MESAPPPVDRADQQRLLRWARQAIDVAIRGAPDQRIDEAELSDDLRAPRAAFVTLTEAGELRGCIGRLDPGRPLWESVVHAAVNAAIADPRFAPVELDELGRIRLEISVLDPPVEITDPAEFDPAVHGIIVERGPRRGLLLPKVGAQHGWSREQTLAAACWKADLPLDAWRDPETRLLVFTAFVFGEPAEPESEPRPSRSAECRLASRTRPPRPGACRNQKLITLSAHSVQSVNSAIEERWTPSMSASSVRPRASCTSRTRRSVRHD